MQLTYKIGYQNSKYRDFFNEVSSDRPTNDVFNPYNEVLSPIKKEKK